MSAFASEPNNLSSSPRISTWKERTNTQKLCSELSAHACMLLCTREHTHVNKCNFKMFSRAGCVGSGLEEPRVLTGLMCWDQFFGERQAEGGSGIAR